MPPTTCLPRETLKGYLNGSADELEISAIESHLAECPSCEQTIVELEANPDTVFELLREQQQAPSQENSEPPTAVSVVQRAVEAIRQLDSQLNAPSGPLEKSGKIREQQIGAYQLIRPLGRGGMGLVMLARHTSLNKQVAVKILPSLIGDRPELVRRFEREIVAAGKLNHPAIVNATDAGREQGTHYLVMEFIDGLDLSRIARLSGPLRIADACELIRQAALGLSYAHAQGIVHRDIKPSNLMLDDQGRVKILDFGLAQLSLWDEAACELTTVGQLMGTLDYMAPEQAERVGAVDHRADLYALGATLFRLLTGRAPLAASPNMTLLEKLKLLGSQAAPSVLTLREDCPAELVQLVSQLLSRDPSERPSSAAHVAEALSPLCNGHQLVQLLATARTKPEPLSEELARASLDTTGGRTRDSSLTGSQPPRRTGWLIAAAMVPLLIFAGTLIALETQKGQLIIESEVADVQVRIASGGKISQEMIVKTGAQSTRLSADKYEITIDGASDELAIDQNQVEIKRGGTVVARITKKLSAAASNRAFEADKPKQNDILDRQLFSYSADGYSLRDALRQLSAQSVFSIEVNDDDYQAAVKAKNDDKTYYKLEPGDEHTVRSILDHLLAPFNLAYAVVSDVRGRKIIVGSRERVENFSGKPIAGGPERTIDSTAKGLADSSSTLTYKGKPLDHWLENLQRDLDYETKKEAADAIVTLGRGANQATRIKIRDVLISVMLRDTPNYWFQHREVRSAWYTSAYVQLHIPVIKYLARPLFEICQPQEAYEAITSRALAGSADEQLIGLFAIADTTLEIKVDEQYCMWLLQKEHFAALDENIWLALVYIENYMGQHADVAKKIWPQLYQRVIEHPKLGMPVALILQARVNTDQRLTLEEKHEHMLARRFVEDAIASRAVDVLKNPASSPAEVALAACRLASTGSIVETQRNELIPVLNDRLTKLAEDSAQLLAEIPIVPDLKYKSDWYRVPRQHPGSSAADQQAIEICQHDYDQPKREGNMIYTPNPRYFGSEAVALLALTGRLTAVRELDAPLTSMANKLSQEAGGLPAAMFLQLTSSPNNAIKQEFEEFIWPFDKFLGSSKLVNQYPPKTWRAWKLWLSIKELCATSELQNTQAYAAILRAEPTKMQSLGSAPLDAVIPGASSAETAWVERQIAKYDKNKDGVLTQDEWSTMIIKPKDFNGDGVITTQEFILARKGRSDGSASPASPVAPATPSANSPPQPATQDNAPKATDQSAVPIYNGQSLEQWLRIFENDLNMKSRADALSAIRMLCKDLSLEQCQPITERVLKASDTYLIANPLRLPDAHEWESEWSASTYGQRGTGRANRQPVSLAVETLLYMRKRLSEDEFTQFLKDRLTSYEPKLAAHWMYAICWLQDSPGPISFDHLFDWITEPERFAKYPPDVAKLAQVYAEQYVGSHKELPQDTIEALIERIKSHQSLGQEAVLKFRPLTFNVSNAEAATIKKQVETSVSRYAKHILFDEQASPLLVTLAACKLSTVKVSIMQWREELTPLVSKRLSALAREPERLLSKIGIPEMAGERLGGGTAVRDPRTMEFRSSLPLLVGNKGVIMQSMGGRQVINSEVFALLSLAARLRSTPEMADALTAIYQVTSDAALEVLSKTDVAMPVWSTFDQDLRPEDSPKDVEIPATHWTAAAINSTIEQMRSNFHATLTASSLVDAIALQQAKLTIKKYDSDGDNQLNSEESQKAQLLGNPEETWTVEKLVLRNREAMIRSSTAALDNLRTTLSKYDRNQDGVLSKEEWDSGFANQYDVEVDMNHDDQITLDEYARSR